MELTPEGLVTRGCGSVEKVINCKAEDKREEYLKYGM